MEEDVNEVDDGSGSDDDDDITKMAHSFYLSNQQIILSFFIMQS